VPRESESDPRESIELSSNKQSLSICGTRKKAFKELADNPSLVFFLAFFFFHGSKLKILLVFNATGAINRLEEKLGSKPD
jgi:hypothetical protein